MNERPAVAPVLELSRLDQNMVELSLVLPQWQIDALDEAARDRGISAGQMLRRLIGNYCMSLGQDR